jgi:8-oxo-dGTP pyrophosphatase MutT (NUDIX family)
MKDIKTNPEFNNKPNGRIQVRLQDSDGNKQTVDYWTSRAVAVVGIVFAYTTDGLFVLLEKRGGKMLDFPNKICLPCGYLDWDETVYEAMVREVYEETSLYIPDFKNYIINKNQDKPIYISDSPLKFRQNISMFYLTVLDFRGDMEAFPFQVSEYVSKESVDVKWVNIDDVMLLNDDSFAFNHNETIKTALTYVR